MSNPDAERYWREHIDSGEFDDKNIPTSGHEVLVDFDIEDLLILEDALHRRFLQIKKDRTGVIRAVIHIRRAMKRVMKDDNS